MYLTYQTRIAFRLSAIALSAVLSACGSNNNNQNTGTPAVSIEQPVVSLSGRAMGGRQPIVGATVYVYAASGSSSSAPVQIGSATTTASGTFSITSFSPAPATGDLIYVSSVGGDAGSGNNPQAALMTVAGTYGSLTGNVQINELTTVAAVSQLQDMLVHAPCSEITGNTAGSGNCPVIKGQKGGWSTLISAIASLVNASTGQANSSLGSRSLQNMNLQASVLANCINSNGGIAGDNSACGNLLLVAYPTGLLTKKSPATVATGTSNATIAVTPDGKLAYVKNANSVSVFSIANNGVLTPKTPATVNAVSQPVAVAIRPDGKTIYFLSADNYLTSFSIGNNGALTMTGTEYGGYIGIEQPAIAITPDGKYAYVTYPDYDAITVFSLASDGTPTYLGAVAAPQSWALAIAPNGKTLYVGNNGLSSVSAFSIGSDGALTELGSTATADTPISIALTPDGKTAYSVSRGGSAVFVLSVGSDGKLSLKTSIATGSGTKKIVVSPDGKTAYVVCEGESGIYGYNIASDGALTLKSTGFVITDSIPGDIAITPNGRSIYVASFAKNISMFSVAIDKPTNSQSGIIGLHVDPVYKANLLFSQKPVTAVFTPMPSSAPTTLALP